MDVKEAVALAKKYVDEVFAGEPISDVGLEEIEFDDVAGIWSITIGFSRPWETTKGLAASFLPTKRDYKVVRISDVDRKMLSVKNRALAG